MAKAGQPQPAQARSLSPQATEHITRLSTHKTYKPPSELYLEQDFRGLISTDFRTAELTYNGTRAPPKDFPVPWSLYSTVKTTSPKVDEPPLSHLVEAKVGQTEQKSVEESIRQINAFNEKYGRLKMRVGFPRNKLKQLDKASIVSHNSEH
jgi:hypothetical protein